MVEKDEMGLLADQVRNIILNRPLDKRFVDTNENELQGAFLYLSNCLSEANEFLRSLCKGELDAKSPSKHNFLAGNLKELHSVLKHLSWQTQQVAAGDYQQRVVFLGEFSNAFNEMVFQLEERETKLKEKTEELSGTMDLLVSIMKMHKDWILVMDYATKDIIYVNQSAQKCFYDLEKKELLCSNNCELFKMLAELGEGTREYHCAYRKKYMIINSYPIKWKEKDAIAHYIEDITTYKENTNNLEEMAYFDELTGVYNRRFCMEKLNELIISKNKFSIVLVDLDNLKYVNDYFGHVAGDEFICSITSVIKENIRGTDIVARIGGDEFIIILQDCDDLLAQQKMQKIRTQVIEASSLFPQSLSYGISYIPADNTLDLQEVLDITDSRMYLFKRQNKTARRIDSSIKGEVR